MSLDMIQTEVIYKTTVSDTVASTKAVGSHQATAPDALDCPEDN